MLFYIGLSFLATLQVIELQLDVFKTRLDGTNVDNFFEVEGLRVDNSEYVMAMTQLTFTEAMIYCRRMKAQLYTPKQGQPIRRIFDRFSLKTIWTTIFKEGPALVDGEGFPPDLETDLNTIGLSRLTLSEMTDSKQRVVLTRMEVTDLTDTPFQLERKIFSDKANVICVRELSFPFRSSDVDHMKRFIKQVGTRLDTHKENIQEIKAQAQALLATLPRIGEGVSIIENDIIDLQTKLNGKLGNLRRRFDSTITDIRLVRSVVELSVITAELQGTFNQMYIIIDKVLEPLRYPLGLISAAYHPYIEPVSYNYTDDVSSQVVLFYVNDSMLLLKVGSEKTKIQPTISQTATFFNKRYFYSVTLIDLILVITSSLVSVFAMVGIIMNCYSIRQNYKRHKNLLKTSVRYVEPKVRKVSVKNPETTEIQYIRDRQIGLPTTLPHRHTDKNRRVKFISDLPSHLTASNLSL